jgi:hypothetical protein
MNIHGRMGMGMLNALGATLAIASPAVKRMPASLESENFVFIFTPELVSLVASLNQMQCHQQHIDNLDPDEWHEQTTETVDQEIVT